MNVERRRSRLGLWEEVMNVEDDYSRRGKNGIPQRKSSSSSNMPLSLSQSQGQKGKIILCYFKLESVLLLVCLTASLLILPLVLPPLPPPPFLLLLLPIFILALLMLLAFMPSNACHAAYTYV